MKLPTLVLMLAVYAASAVFIICAQAQAPAPNPPGQAAPGGGGTFGRGGPEGDPTPGFGRPMIDLYAAGVAGSRARGSTTLFNDLETTIMTRFDEKMEKELAAVRKARADLIAASLDSQANSADIAAKAQVLADAEFALAIRRADEFPALVSALGLSNPERMANFIPQMLR